VVEAIPETAGPSGPIQTTSIQYVPTENEVDILITWEFAPKLSYTLEFTDDFVTWNEGPGNIESQGPQTTFRHTLPETIPSKNFFRIRQVAN